jgi:hypothetical protein
MYKVVSNDTTVETKSIKFAIRGTTFYHATMLKFRPNYQKGEVLSSYYLRKYASQYYKYSTANALSKIEAKFQQQYSMINMCLCIHIINISVHTLVIVHIILSSSVTA